MKALIIKNRNEKSLENLIGSLSESSKGKLNISFFDTTKNQGDRPALKDWLLSEMSDEEDDLFMIMDENKYCLEEFEIEQISETMKNPEIFCFSLALGKNITFCANMNCENVLKTDSETDSVMVWDWSVHYMDFGYPLNLDGTVFRGKELIKMIKNISFANTLELENSLQIFDNYPKTKMASFKKGKIVEIVFEKQELWATFDQNKLEGDRIKYQIIENEASGKIPDTVEA